MRLFFENETFTTKEYTNSKKNSTGHFSTNFRSFSKFLDTDQLLCELVGSPDEKKNPGADSVEFEKKLVVPPERNKIEDDGDYEDDNKGKPGEEGNAEVEHVFDALENVG